MFTKQQQRMLKCGLSALYAENSDRAAYPLYFMERAECSLEETFIGVAGLQSLEQIPWPEHKCIVICEDNLLSRWFKVDELVMHFYVPQLHPAIDAELRKPFGALPRAGVTGLVITVDSAGNPYVEERDDIVMTLADDQAMREIDFTSQSDPDLEPDDMLQSIKNAAQKTISFWLRETRRNWPANSPLTDDGARLMRKLHERYEIQGGGLENCWTALGAAMLQALPVGAERAWFALRLLDREQQQSEFSFGQAVCMLTHLLNVIMPCGYRVKASFREGFGTKRMRRLTRGKPIYCHVGYNRMATMTKEASECAPVEPHFVRGHIRNLWKRAGIDRALLPPESHKRLLLAQQHKVTRVYVHPYWTGPRAGYHDGVDWEIDQGETELPEL